MNLKLFEDIENIVNNTSNYNRAVVNSNTIKNSFPAETPLAMAYVPFQQIKEVYEADTALKNGTLFPELDFPFMNGGDCCE
ncbi:MAG: spore coat associated protein CotJA [Ruminococcus sp.]|nr:spore coat associated protein CotJA [Ruminococcus sp.]MBO5383097.1 spore coat associated protein CotJA [Ruminococcus sp.]MBR6670909.1 spore coat associated protein CotJA [Ruminococcus sp.]